MTQMRIKKIFRWISSDGAIFDCAEGAFLHEMGKQIIYCLKDLEKKVLVLSSFEQLKDAGWYDYGEKIQQELFQSLIRDLHKMLVAEFASIIEECEEFEVFLPERKGEGENV
jgi:hypothetical protein